MSISAESLPIALSQIEQLIATAVKKQQFKSANVAETLEVSVHYIMSHVHVYVFRNYNS